MAATGLFLTPTVVKLFMMQGEREVGTGTGFFIFIGGLKYIVSAWHVIAGRDPTTGQPRNKCGMTPDRMVLAVSSIKETQIMWTLLNVDLGSAIDGGATWYAHPAHGQDVDIAVVPLGENFESGLARDLLDPEGHDPNMFIDTGADVFLPGFPLGIGDHFFPVWKRASVATSLEWGDGEKLRFLVDTASREGMSGAPCFAISNWRHYSKIPGSTKVVIVERPLSHRLLGVYTGRLNAKDDLGAQLGIVWRENLIFDIIRARSLAVVEIRRPPVATKSEPKPIAEGSAHRDVGE
jgi:hypothetical protein